MNKPTRSPKPAARSATTTPAPAPEEAAPGRYSAWPDDPEPAQEVDHLNTHAPEFVKAIADVREAAGYLARNMDEAFGGALGYTEASAYAALTTLLGHICTAHEHAGMLAAKLESVIRPGVSP